MRALRRYFARHASVARKTGTGFILESATWRASRDWADKLGWSAADLEDANRKAIHLLRDIKAEYETPNSKMVISGCIGPRGDGYDPGKIMSPEEAQAYHSQQVRIFADEEVDMISAITMTNVNEAIGIAQAAQEAGLPVVISFTVETDGNLPTGDSLGKAINIVDRATGNGPAYYMINCAHPTHYREQAPVGRAVGRAHRRHARQRVADQPRRAGQRDRTRRRRSRRVRPPVRRHPFPAEADERARRLLRHRPSPHRADRDELRRSEGRISHAN